MYGRKDRLVLQKRRTVYRITRHSTARLATHARLEVERNGTMVHASIMRWVERSMRRWKRQSTRERDRTRDGTERSRVDRRVALAAPRRAVALAVAQSVSGLGNNT